MAGHEDDERVQASTGPWPSSLRDRRPEDYLARRITDGAEIIAVADALPIEEQTLGLGGPERWSERLTNACQVWDALVALQPDPCGLGIEL